MFGAAETDAFGAVFARGARVARRFGVGPNLHPAGPVGPDHNGREVARQFGLEHGHGAP